MRNSLLLCLCLLSLVAASAHASGINCAKAKTDVEKSICADPKLKEADGAVADAFADALAAASDQNAVRASQRQWLVQRNACPDAGCLTARHQERLKELTERTAEAAAKDQAERARLRAMLGWPEDCEDSFRDLLSRNSLAGTGVTAHALGEGRTLYCVQCELAAYQEVFMAVLQDTPDGPGRVLSFPLYDRDGGKINRSEDTSLAGWPEFNEATKTLAVFYKARGIGDCGSYVVYAFPTRGAPKVVEARARGCSDTSPQKDLEPTRWPLVKNP
jgi:hypothetical protein